MGRVASVSSLKGRTDLVIGSAPRQGSTIRAVYDALHRRAGRPVLFASADRRLASTIETLRVYYGCDISRVDKRTYCLTGEWFGKRYEDYLAQRFKTE